MSDEKKLNSNVTDATDLLKDAVESIRDYAIFILDPQGYIRTWNQGAERLKGYSPEEAIGMRFSNFYTPQDLGRNHPDFELEEAKKTGRYEEEGWRVRKDGSRFWANVVITKLLDKDGRLIGFSKVTRDLTVRKEEEERLRQSEERFRLLVAGVKDYAIFMLDPQGNVASWNEGASRIKGYTAEEITGQHFSVFYPPEDVVAGKCEYELKEASLTGRFEDEGWRVRKDGTRLWANVVITAIRDEAHNLLGFTKVTRDLTERRRAEDRLQRAYADLERRIKERTFDLETANTELEKREAALRQALSVRDEFLSIASHELKTPITSVKMQLQMLERVVKPGATMQMPPARAARLVSGSLSQVDRLTRLIEDLLDVVRTQAQKLTFKFEDVDLRELTEEVIERFRADMERSKCEVAISCKSKVVGHFDRFRMDQVLVNLLTNAFKYAPGSKIDISIAAEGTNAQLRFGDNGPGISPSDQEKLFERYERGVNATNLSGLGLGLYITKAIVSGHNGTIRVESELGKGTDFVIDLPLKFAATPRLEKTL